RPARSVSNRTLGWGLLAVALVLPGCSSRARDDVRGGESHFLQSCTSECGDGLTCIDNRCTRECEERDDCRGLAKNAVCAVSDDADERPVCSVESVAPCREGGLNDALGQRWDGSDGCNTCECTESGV